MNRLYFLLFPLALIAAAALAADTNAAVAPAPSFQARCAALAQAAEAKGTMTVTGREGWLFLASELRHLGVGRFWGEAAAKVSRAAKPDQADPLPAIKDFHDQLAAMGIDLLIVPVPPKAVIYPEYLPSPASSAQASSRVAISPTPTGRPDTVLEAFYDQLRLLGIRVLDLTPLFMSNRLDPQAAVYCWQDSHWSGTGCVLAAREIASAISAGLTNYPKQAFTGAWETVEISGDLWLALPDPKPPKEKVRIRRITHAGQGGAADPDLKSPVILLGDSHGLVFHGGDDMLAKDAGLSDQLALELGFPVDLAAVRGSGATPARINLLRRAQKDPSYWAGKKWVVWCFSAREFTESDGWRKVPLKP